MRGKCLCGAIEFEINGKLPKAYQCHCSLCRKQSGTAYNTSLMISNDKFRWLVGPENISSYVKDTGYRSDFCSRCGSPVPNPLRDTSYIWVPGGLLEADATIEIGAHLYIGSKAAWDIPPTGGRHYQTMPDLVELIRLLEPPK